MQLTDVFCYAVLTITMAATCIHAEGNLNDLEEKHLDRRMSKRMSTVIIDGIPVERMFQQPKVIYRRISQKRYPPSRSTHGPPRPKYGPPRSARKPAKKYRGKNTLKRTPSSHKKRAPKPRYGPPSKKPTMKPVYGPPKQKPHRPHYQPDYSGFGEPPHSFSKHRPVKGDDFYNSNLEDDLSNTEFENDFPPKPDFGNDFPSKPGFGNGFPSKPVFGNGFPLKPDFGNGFPQKPDFGNGFPQKPDFGNGFPQKPDFGNGFPQKPDFGNGFPQKPDFGSPFPSKPDFGSSFSLKPNADFTSPASFIDDFSHPFSDDFPPKTNVKDYPNKPNHNYGEPPVDSYGAPIKPNLRDLTSTAQASLDSTSHLDEDISGPDSEYWPNFRDHKQDNNYAFSKKRPSFSKPDPEIYITPTPPDHNEEQDLKSYSDIYNYRQNKNNNKKKKKNQLMETGLMLNKPWKGKKVKAKDSNEEIIVGGQYAEPPARYVPKFQPSAPMDNQDDSVFSPPLSFSDPDIASSATMSSYVNYKNSNMAFSPQNLNDAFSIIDK